jgi:hypothetical protein
MSQKEVMVDIETLGTTPNSVILTIGALKFERNKGLQKLEDLEQFSCRIDVNSCVYLGLEINKETEEWWENQSEVARNEVFNTENRIPIKEALLKLSDFCRGCKCFWANSPNFDFVILENCYRKCGLEYPWKFWLLRDTRTVYDLGNVRLIGTAHTSLSDCYNQYLVLKSALTNLGF